MNAGFVTSKIACCGQGPYNGLGLCTALSNLCPNRDLYAFWDPFHPSEKANRIIVQQIMRGSTKYMNPMNLSTVLALDQSMTWWSYNLKSLFSNFSFACLIVLTVNDQSWIINVWWLIYVYDIRAMMFFGSFKQVILTRAWLQFRLIHPLIFTIGLHWYGF